MRATIFLLLLTIQCIGQPFTTDDAPLTLSGSSLRKGLVGSWRMEQSGTVPDRSPFRNHLTAINTVGLAAGKVGNAASFAVGSSGYLKVASNSSLLMTNHTEWTMWCYLTNLALGTDIYTLLAKYQTTNNHREYSIRYEPSAGNWFRLVVSTNGTGTLSCEATNWGAITSNTWYFINAGYNGSNLFISVNNGQRNVTTTAMPMQQDTSDLLIGSMNAIASRYFIGRIDEVNMWNRNLTSAEVTHLYQEGLGNTHPFVHSSSNSWQTVSAVTNMAIATYDGNNALLHADLQYFPSQWNGWEYWMAFTPYPNYNPVFENPSIVVSHDGNVWQVPPGGSNPVVGYPGAGMANSDPDLTVWTNNVAYLYYRCSDATTNGTIYKTSSDGVTWSAPTCVIAETNSVHTWASPTIVWDGTNCVMVVSDVLNNTLDYRTSTNMAGPWGSPTSISLTLDGTQKFWHQDFEWYNNTYWILIISYTGRFYLASSTDLATWTLLTPTGFFGAGTATWDAVELYRGSMIPINSNTWDFFYAGRTGLTGGAGQDWRIGRTTLRFKPD